MGKIRYFELDSSLQAILNSKISINSNTTIIEQNTIEVPIGIENFNSTNDYLIVFINGIFINTTTDYTINENNTISLKDRSEWIASDVKKATFNFIAIKQVDNNIEPKYTDGNLIKNNTITEEKLSKSIVDKLNLMTNDYAEKKSMHILASDWTAITGESTVYEYNIIHNKNTKNIIVSVFDVDGNEVNVSKKIVNMNTIKISTNTACECDITVI